MLVVNLYLELPKKTSIFWKFHELILLHSIHHHICFRKKFFHFPETVLFNLSCDKNNLYFLLLKVMLYLSSHAYTIIYFLEWI